MSQEEQEQERHQNLQYWSILKSNYDIGGVYQKFFGPKIFQYFTSNIYYRLSQSQATWAHCGQEICIESQEISVNIHVFDLVASQMSDIK